MRVKRHLQRNGVTGRRIRLLRPPNLAELTRTDDRLQFIVGAETLAGMKKNRCHASLRNRTKCSASDCRPITAWINMTLDKSGRRTTGPPDTLKLRLASNHFVSTGSP